VRKSRKQRGRTVIVEHDNVDKAIKKLRRLVTDNNIMK
jgi:ribosomal protein S21